MTTHSQRIQKQMRGLRGLPMDDFGAKRTGSEPPSTHRSSAPASQISLLAGRATSEQAPMTSVQPSQPSTADGTEPMQGTDTGSLQNNAPNDEIRAGRRNPANPHDGPAPQTGHRRSPSDDLLYSEGPFESPESPPPTIDPADFHDPEPPAGSGQHNQGSPRTNQNQSR